MAMNDRPTISVVICTRGRPGPLQRAIASLMGQTSPPTELLVVDNAPQDGATRDVVSSFGAAKYVLEPVPGLDFARNRGLGEAGGDIVAFLDDDAVADSHWCDAIVRAFADDAKLGACTGRVEALTTASSGQRLFEDNGGFSRGLEPVVLPTDAARRLHGRRAPLIAWAVSIGAGCSLAVRRDAANAIGGFDEALDMGQVLPGGGDHDMLWRIMMAGHRLRYEPTALAWHEHRHDLQAAYDQIVGHQRALIALLVKCSVNARGPGRWAIMAFLGWRLCKPLTRLVRRVAGRDPLPIGVLLRMWGHCWRGLWAYPAARREADRRRTRFGQTRRSPIHSLSDHLAGAISGHPWSDPRPGVTPARTRS